MHVGAIATYLDEMLVKTIQHPWTWSDGVGFIGMFTGIMAYILVSQKDIKPDRYPFHILNLLTGCFLGINALATQAFPIFIFEIFWIIVSVINMFDIRRNNIFDAYKKKEAK